jgi:hypothetical protein
MRGSIHVQSRIGEGTTFTIDLQLAESVLGAKQTADTASDASDSSRSAE